MPPLGGTLNMCLPAALVDRYGVRAARSDIVYSGTASAMPGLVAPADAEIAARRLIRNTWGREAAAFDRKDIERYEARLAKRYGVARGEIGSGDSMTWLSVDVRDGAYGAGSPGYWLFQIDAAIHRYDPYATEKSATLVVRVDADGRTCPVGEGEPGYYQPFIRDGRYMLDVDVPGAQSFILATDWHRPCKGRKRPVPFHRKAPRP
jgi:hypothetical protein